MKTKILFLAVIAAFLAIPVVQADGPGLRRDFAYKKGDGTVDILKDGKLVARYVFKDTPKPYFYPVYAPNGEKVTRGFPVESIPGEPRDHPHHRSFWIAFGDVNGIDFWTEGNKAGKIVQTSIDFRPRSPGYWAIHTKNDWIGPDGNKVCQDERSVTFLSCDYGTLVSTMITLSAPEREVKLGDTKEGFFALRVASGLQVKSGKGSIMNSEGDKDSDAWGKPARWCDYTGEVNGKACGITIFDAPLNYGHPTYWQVQDYGLLAANPFGGAAFTGDSKNDSGLTIPPYGSKTFVYATLIHDGKLDAESLNRIADQVVGRGPGMPSPSDDANGATAPDGRRVMPLPVR